ncbi:polyribonucleotide nucleotidyltransferase [Candidatus Kaiserbacteria bacterium]|nr:polyribonucleotide nucleotidyltransferase [Candidatus Kaiserbacteria bacterium]
MQKKEYSTEIGGKTLTATFTDLTDQADGSVIVQCGNTTVLATVVMTDNKKEGLGYFPLTVDYEEKFYAAGAILGSRFMRREGRPTDDAILSGRVVDRTIRPLFDQRIRNDVHVVVTVLSIDEDDPDVLGIIAASLALGTSDVPWEGPVSSVRIGKFNGDFVINPSYSTRDSKESTLDLLACGKNGGINMIEIGAYELDEQTLSHALEEASRVIEEIQAFQRDIISEIGKTKRVVTLENYSEELKTLFEKEITPKLESAVFSGAGKKGIYTLKDEWKLILKEALPEADKNTAEDYFEEMINVILHEKAINEDRRPDGRKMNEVRELFAQAGGISEVIHGTGIFYRGGTHVLSALTLGGPGDSQIIDSMESQDTEKRFMHHYNFPPYSVGETGRMGGTNRRMIGHGALAEKALIPVIPTQEEFPYTIRIVSEVLASNGSSSMGSVCGSTLALMDGGVPIKKPVAGIAMGLMLNERGDYKILTDIQGPEDEHGDMDLKVAGTKDGVTAVQMDVKVNGIPINILTLALEDARRARLHILEVIEKAIPKTRESVSAHAPKIETLTIKEEQIGLIIGPGGKTINEIKDETGVTEITIEQTGLVYVIGKGDTTQKARAIIEEMTREYNVGETFEGEVTRVLDFGAFVKIGHNTEGLVHVSELAPYHIDAVSKVVSVGEIIPVIIKEIDERHRINLSVKQVDPDFAKKKGVMPLEK